MRMLMVTAGSRGDVEPVVALARRAAAAGHAVRLAVPDRSGADTSGMDAVSLDVDFTGLIESQGVSAIAALRAFSSVVRPIMRAVIINTVRVALEYRPDVIIYHPKVLSAPVAADHLGIPHIVIELVPALTPTSTFAAVGTVTANLGAANALTYRAVAATARMFSREMSEARALLSATPSRGPSLPAASLVPISPQILPRPHDWPATTHLTGAWMSARTAADLDPAVESFVDAGPFLYAGFGSMAAGDADARGRALVDAARATRLRLLVATGLGGIAIPEELRAGDVLVTASADHERILPRATAAIHHGGIGTVQAVARSGITSIIVPFIADQPFWGAQLHRRGLAPAPIPYRRLTAARVMDALEQVPSYTERNREVGRAMSVEDGPGAALAAIEQSTGA